MKKSKADLELDINDLQAQVKELEEEREKIASYLGAVDMECLLEELAELNDELNPPKGYSLADRARDLTADAAEADNLRTQNQEFENQIIDLEAALAAAREDRDKMLKRLGLTDFEWSSQGGNSYTDVEV